MANGTLAAAGAGRRAHRWPPDNRQTSTLPRRTSFASSGADLSPSSSFQTAPNGYSTSQEPERTFSAAVADALDAWAPGDVATQQHAPCTIGKGNAIYRRGRPRTALTSGELALRRRLLSRRRRLRRRRRQEGGGRCKWADGPNRPRSGRGSHSLLPQRRSFHCIDCTFQKAHRRPRLLLALLEDSGTPSRPLDRGRQARRRRLNAERASEPGDASSGCRGRQEGAAAWAPSRGSAL